MAEHLVTFRVNQARMFDALREASGDTGLIGAELVFALMTPADVSALGSIKMAIWGITMEQQEVNPDA